MLRAVAVFCGSSLGHDPRHRDAARALADVLVRRGIALVYGGGRVGLMGELADAVFAGGGRVIGVIPAFLRTKELLHPRIAPGDLLVPETLFKRKEWMIERADAFVTMAGGLGTLDELFEVVTLAQLGRHAKPCGLLNVAGYFDPLLEQLRRAIDEGFLDRRHVELLRVHAEPAALVAELAEREDPAGGAGRSGA
jgi:uncharacterized protein (TIGR00730 family)